MTGIDEVLRHGHVRSVFQPIVELDSGAVVAYEALARGPQGPLERPDLLFAAARAAGRLRELDELCRRTALRTAITTGVLAPLTLFVNVEPEVLDTAPLEELLAIGAAAPRDLQVVLEITERAIAARPAELLATVQRLRAAGWRIALDDVGADDLSLAFMPLLRPDIIKLDLKLVQQRPGPELAEIMHAVNAEAERAGTVVLAEGIEHEGHLSMALALGARLGQGWLFGRPSDNLASGLPTAALQLRTPPVVREQASPFACLPEGTPLRRSTKALLIEVSKHLEREAMRLGSTCTVVAAFQEARHFTPGTAHRYRELADRVGFVAAIGEGLPPEPVAGVRGADLDADDTLRGEWDVAVLAPHFAAALLARDLGDTGADRERTFEFALTYDREVVADAAQALMSRVLPQDALRLVAPDATGGAADDRSTPAAADAPAGPGPGGSERTLRRALAATGNGVTISDVTRPDQPLVYVNTAFERLAGLRAEEALGRSCRFLQGPDTDADAVARLRAAIAEGREARETLLNHRGPERTPWWNEIYVSPVFDDDGRLIQYIGVQNDVTDQVKTEERLRAEHERSQTYLREVERLASRDPLTGLLSRRRLAETLESTLLQAQVAGTGVAVLYVDLVGFKKVNDVHGHAVGDELLQAVADRLRTRLRRGDMVARLGGDEFLVILPALDPTAARAEGERVAGELADVLSQPVTTARGTLDVRASIGVSAYPADGSDFDRLVHAADQRMHDAKVAHGVMAGGSFD